LFLIYFISLQIMIQAVRNSLSKKGNTIYNLGMGNNNLLQKLKKHTKSELIDLVIGIHTVGDKKIQAMIEVERSESSHFFSEGDIIDLLVIRPLNTALRCKILSTGELVTFRKNLFEIPGDTITVEVSKHWKNNNTSYISGKRIKQKFILSNLNLKPIQIKKYDTISLSECLLDDEHPKNIRAIYNRIFTQKEYDSYEMENIIPGIDYEDIDSDPIYESVELKNSGKTTEAINALLDLLEMDFRCIDAYSHLGSINFPDDEESSNVRDAMSYYEAGMKIGEYLLGPNFDGQLPWGLIDNRPYLRTLHGYGLCLMRKGENKEALDVFEKILRLSPMDNLGVRFLIDEI
nr:tetratricopeptide repeat protein [Spirochaetia bacterium]